MCAQNTAVMTSVATLRKNIHLIPSESQTLMHSFLRKSLKYLITFPFGNYHSDVSGERKAEKKKTISLQIFIIYSNGCVHRKSSFFIHFVECKEQISICGIVVGASPRRNHNIIFRALSFINYIKIIETGKMHFSSFPSIPSTFSAIIIKHPNSKK